MTDFLLYTKALFVSIAAVFGVLWCCIGIREAMVAMLQTMAFLMVIGAILSSSVTLLFLFCDWKNRNEEPDPS